MRRKKFTEYPPIACSFGGKISNEHFNCLSAILERMQKRKGRCGLTEAEQTQLRGFFEELAAEFLLRQRYLELGQTPTSQKRTLDQIESSARRFMDALDKIDRSLWLSLYCRLGEIPEGFDIALTAYVTGNQDAGPENIRSHFDLVAQLGQAAPATRKALGTAKSAKRTYEAVRWATIRLAPVYREVTGVSPTANPSGSYHDHPLGRRATPFVRFVGAFIKPFAPDLYAPGLGKAVASELERLKTQPIRKDNR